MEKIMERFTRYFMAVAFAEEGLYEDARALLMEIPIQNKRELKTKVKEERKETKKEMRFL
jgi:hypothetical protein